MGLISQVLGFLCFEFSLPIIVLTAISQILLFHRSILTLGGGLFAGPVSCPSSGRPLRPPQVLGPESTKCRRPRANVTTPVNTGLLRPIQSVVAFLNGLQMLT